MTNFDIPLFLKYAKALYEEKRKETRDWEHPTRQTPNPAQTRDALQHVISILEKKNRPLS